MQSESASTGGHLHVSDWDFTRSRCKTSWKDQTVALGQDFMLAKTGLAMLNCGGYRDKHGKLECAWRSMRDGTRLW
jgi:hypothetical protein